MKTVGVVGATYEAAADIVKLICGKSQQRFGNARHPEIILHIPERELFLQSETNRQVAWAEILLNSSKLLAQSGAEFVVCPSNGAHVAYANLLDKTPIPWLPLPQAVAQAAKNRGFSRVGLLGTSYLLEHSLYPEVLSSFDIAVDIPERDERTEMHRIIREELFKGEVKGESREFLLNVVMSLKNSGSQAVILGCTELPLVLNDENSSLPVLDSLDILAEAAVEHLKTL